MIAFASKPNSAMHDPGWFYISDDGEWHGPFLTCSEAFAAWDAYAKESDANRNL